MQLYVIEYDRKEGNGLETSQVIQAVDEYRALREWAKTWHSSTDRSKWDVTVYPLEEGRQVINNQEIDCLDKPAKLDAETQRRFDKLPLSMTQ